MPRRVEVPRSRRGRWGVGPRATRLEQNYETERYPDDEAADKNEAEMDGEGESEGENRQGGYNHQTSLS